MRITNKGNRQIPTSVSLVAGFLLGVLVMMMMTMTIMDRSPVDSSFTLLEDSSAHVNCNQHPKTSFDGTSNKINSYELAYKDSGGFFQDISESDWRMLKDRVQTRQNHLHMDDPLFHLEPSEGWYQENFEPDFTCLHERRIGGMGDGPKWVCDPHRLTNKKDCLIYSVGSEGNFMFENALLKEIGKHCEIHTFDPEIQGISYGHLAPLGVHYHNWGFMSKSSKEAQNEYYWNAMEFQSAYKTMKETIETLGHVGREIDIFKIDCEGCEWTTFPDWFRSGATLRQILVEVHKTPDDTVNEFFTGMQENGYVTFHKEPNIQFAQGSCVEYAFLKLEDSFFQK
ncbi:unnamed protein product [Cylindrotheca closterium]|uniref:Methyltransferase domain-containing protein n=1 Tax=Cylindrotheca closterium TaxID=2856 RepID=A0AAD2JN57_9STRA|nr:unnamed protein product [Cylindrotheca closterium]